VLSEKRFRANRIQISQGCVRPDHSGGKLFPRHRRGDYLRARREAVHQAIARLQQAMGIAGVTVLKLMTDPNFPAAVRLRAAECVFAHAIRGLELEASRKVRTERRRIQARLARQRLRLARRLSALEQQRRKAVKEPIRVIFQSVCGEPNLANSYFKRTLHPDGTLVETVFLDGAMNDRHPRFDLRSRTAGTLPIMAINSQREVSAMLPRYYWITIESPVGL